jgi:TetR/AcrR family transcriptional repressor of nem operon
MPKDGSTTRAKILDTALDLILKQGFGSTSIDNVIKKVGITKGAFFYHFKSKRDMAIALINRFAEHDGSVLTEQRERAEKLASDPLQQLLVFIGLFEETFEQLEEPYPGCLFAVYSYQGDMFDDEVREIVNTSLLRWRHYIVNKINETMQTRKPRLEIDVESLADMMTTVFEGAFIMSKTFNDPALIAKHLRHYRNYIELLFMEK